MNLSDFYGKIFMMDIMSYIYKFKVSMQERWLQSVINLIKTFKRNNVHVNIVFEGEAPTEKNKEREQRRKQRKQQEQRIVDIKNDIYNYHKTGIVSDLLKEVYNKINQTNTDKIDRLLHFNSNQNQKKTETNLITLNYKILEQIENYLDKKENQLVTVTEKDATKIKEICDVFGVPYFQSVNEAETLCCKMCYNVKETDQENSKYDISEYFSRYKIPIGVISEDSDVLAYGANMLLCDLNISTGECNVIYLPSLLKTMELNYNEFLHFCVLSGTDYNTNIPGVGSVKCLELLKKYRSIENIFKNEDKLIEKKIEEAIKKRKNNVDKLNKQKDEQKKGEELEKLILGETLSEKIHDEENEIFDDNMTIKTLYKDMIRATEMFEINKEMNKGLEKCKYWETNINYNKVCECCLKYNVYSKSIENIWTNNIKLYK
jgi:5'-3' exonuclease